MAATAQVIQFLLSRVSSGNTSLSGGKVFFYAAGTSTPKTVWLDRNKATPAANPYTLDANGTAQIYADGLYRIVIQNSKGAVQFDRDGLAFTDYSGDVTSINAKLWKHVSDYTDLAAAVASIGSTPATLAYNTDQNLSADLSTPVTLELLPLDGAVINHGNYAVSYAGSTARWPMVRVFNGTGAVTLTGTGVIRPEWWGARGGADSGAALQSAFNAAQWGVNRVDAAQVFLSAHYLTSQRLQLNYHGITIQGTGSKTASITYTGTGTVSSVLYVPTNLTYYAQYHRYKGFTIDGGTKAERGIQAAYIAHSIIKEVSVHNTTLHAIEIGYGWCNDIIGCQLLNNTGNGIYVSTAHLAGGNNAINILRNKIAANDGIGIVAPSGLGMNIIGNTLEGNKKCAMYFTQGISSVNITGNYFETNCETGLAMTGTSGGTFKAAIILNGSSGGYDVGGTYPCKNFTISGNLLSRYYETAFVKAIAVSGMEIENNSFTEHGSGPFHVLSTIYSATEANVSDVVMSLNIPRGATTFVTGSVDLTNFQASRNGVAGTFKVEEETPVNLTKLNPFSWDVVVSGTGGSITKGSIIKDNLPTFAITGLASGGTHYFGITLPAASYPELVGRWVYLGAWVKGSVDTISAQTYSNQSGAGSGYSSTLSATSWRWVEHAVYIDGVSDKKLGIRMTGATAATDTLYIASPVMATVGLHRDQAYLTRPTYAWAASAAPTTGTWAVDDRVVRSPQVVGQPKAWVCTVAGSPGTWVSEGNL